MAGDIYNVYVPPNILILLSLLLDKFVQIIFKLCQCEHETLFWPLFQNEKDSRLVFISWVYFVNFKESKINRHGLNATKLQIWFHWE